LGPGAASISRTTSSNVKTTGRFCGRRTILRCRSISARLQVVVKKNRNADTALFMVDVCTFCSR
jgi:hypothetical protein